MDLEILNCNIERVKENAFFKKYMGSIKGHQVILNDNYLYYSNKNEGVDFVFIDEKLSSIHFFGRGHREHSTFKGMLPFEITFFDNKSMLYEKIGKFEIKKGGGDVLPILGKSNEWSIFSIEGYSYRVEFKNEEIVLITLSSLLI